MTREQQDIKTDFYAGNYKELRITVYDVDGNLFDLTSAEVTFAMFTNVATNPEVVLRKSTANGSTEIEILSPATNGVLVVKLKEPDTVNFNGQYRYHVNVKDGNGQEETVTAGMIKIFKSFARRYRDGSIPAFVEGA